MASATLKKDWATRANGVVGPTIVAHSVPVAPSPPVVDEDLLFEDESDSDEDFDIED